MLKMIKFLLFFSLFIEGRSYFTPSNPMGSFTATTYYVNIHFLKRRLTANNLPVVEKCRHFPVTVMIICTSVIVSQATEGGSPLTS